MYYGKWWFIRRSTALVILGLFIFSAWGENNILVGNFSASTFLGLIPAVDPLMALQSFLATGDLYRTAVIGAILVSLLYLVVGGRAFCGWVCPLGLVLDFAHWLSGKLPVKKPFHGFPASTKYYLLAVVLIAPAISGYAIYEMYNPISLLHRSILFGGMGIGLTSWLIIALLFIYELAAAKPGWCKSLCPLGAFYSLLGRFSLVRVVADQTRGAIPKSVGEVCPEPVALGNIINNQPGAGECTLCGACVDRAGNGSLRFSMKPNL